MDTDYHSPTPLRAVFDGAKDFGLTEDEVWGTVDASMYEAGRCQRGRADRRAERSAGASRRLEAAARADRVGLTAWLTRCPGLVLARTPEHLVDRARRALPAGSAGCAREGLLRSSRLGRCRAGRACSYREAQSEGTNRFRSVAVVSPPRMTIAIGKVLDLGPKAPGHCQRHERQARGRRRHQDRRQPPVPAQHERGPKVSPSWRSRCWKWLIMRMPLRAAMPNTVRKPTSEPSDSTPSPSHTNTPAHQGHRQQHERQRRQAQAAERCPQQQEDQAIAAAIPNV